MSALSAKARLANRRVNLKKNKDAYQRYLEKDRLRKASERSAAKNLTSPEKQQQHKEKEKLRAREYRAKTRKMVPITGRARSFLLVFKIKIEGGGDRIKTTGPSIYPML